MIRYVSHTVNTPRIAAVCINALVGTVQSDRLREARERAGFESAADAAQKFGWTESTYRSHENGTRGFGPDVAKKYGRAFKVKPGWLLAMEGIFESAATEVPTEARLVVNAAVEAGAWRETTDWNDDRAFVIEGVPSPVPVGDRFGLVTVGASMDLFYEPGTVLDCISIFKNAPPPESGDHVIAESRRPDGLRELTVKEYLIENGVHYLVPRSSKKEHQQRIRVGRPDVDEPTGLEVLVVGYVVADYPPRRLALFERMGLIKRGTQIFDT